MKTLSMSRYASLLAITLTAGAGCLATEQGADDLAGVDDDALSGSACAVTYNVGSQWDSGFGADVTIKNQGASLNGWKLTWNFPGNQKITSLWNGQVTQSGAAVTITNDTWNSALASGGSVSVGFNGSFSGQNGKPTSFAVNGVACNGAGGGSSASSSGSGSGSGGGGAGGNGSSSSSSSSGSGGGGGASGGFGAIVSKAMFASMFPNENALFGYDALVTAAKDFPTFCNEGSADDRRREAAAFLANISHETTGGWPTAPGGPYAWGLYFTQEVGCENGACTGYCEASNAQYPCAPGKTYHGRGPIQLSYNYNYGAAGAAIGVDLLHNPDLVTSNGVVAFKTGLWFWMTAQSPKPSSHDVMAGKWTPSAQDKTMGRVPGFGMTVNIINGGIECGKATPPQVTDRVGFYQHFAQIISVSPGQSLTCDQMAHY